MPRNRRNIPPPLPPRYPLRHRPAVALQPPCGHRRRRVVFVATVAMLLPLLTPPGERGMMVVMGHGLCVSFWVSGEITKNKVGPKKLQWNLEHTASHKRARDTLANNMARNHAVYK